VKTANKATLEIASFHGERSFIIYVSGRKLRMTLDEANPSASKMSASRWDKISKKFTGTATSGGSSELTTKTVKTFLEMNFTNGYHEQMCGSSKAQPDINPALIMNMRHEAVSYNFRQHT